MQADTLTAAFSQYGKIQSIKLIREKGGMARAMAWPVSSHHYAHPGVGPPASCPALLCI